jgi:hypothetical protein
MVRSILLIIAAIVALVPALASAEIYSEEHLIEKYGLRYADVCVKHRHIGRGKNRRQICAKRQRQEISREHAIRVIPSSPPVFRHRLPPRSEFDGKHLSLLSESEFDSVVRNSEKALNVFWAKVFKSHKAVFIPPVVNIISGDGTGSSYGDNIITMDRNQRRDIVWPYATRATIEATIAHEYGHYVAEVLRIITPTLRVVRSGPLSNTMKYRYEREVYDEIQADYLGGATLRLSGLLREGDPEEIYYVSAGDGADFSYLRGLNRLPDSSVAFEHPLGIDRAILFWQGMTEGNIDKALGILGMRPQWPIKKNNKKRSVR